MGKNKNKNVVTPAVKVDEVAEVKESKVIISDNPFSKVVKPSIEKVEANKNNQVLTDSDLLGNVMM